MNHHSNKFLGVGLGFRAKHFTDIMEGNCKAKWFEALSENYMGMNDSGYGPSIARLRELASKFPIVLHGVSMSVASDYGVEDNYIEKLKNLRDDIKPLWISDHLCFARGPKHNSHDLLPIPFTRSVLETCRDNINKVQDMLGHSIALENISTYLEFEENTMSEWDFLSELQRETQCKILLDINNIVVNCHNHGYDHLDFLKAFERNAVQQFHLAGHIEQNGLKIDTHSENICDKTYELLYEAIKYYGPVAPLIEWDDNIPEMNQMNSHIERVENIYREAGYEAI